MRKRFFAWVYRRFEKSQRGPTEDVRRRLVADLEGRVLEIGAGMGANFEYYAPGVDVTATDYSEHMLPRARETARETQAAIEVEQADVMELPFEDGSFDSAVAALVLCSVPDQARALAEIRRVLKPGGELRLFEHVRSERRGVFAFQKAISPVWGLLADGCQLDRDTEAAVRSAGFEVATAESFELDMSPKLPHLLMFARNPA